MELPKITMTLLVRNEQDIISENIRFHHAQGVDNFIVMDNLSTDNTAKIVQALSQDIEIDYLFQPQDDYNQWEWVTEMAQRAAVEHNSDWIINNDADEFWVAQGDSIKNLLAALPSETSVLYVNCHNAVVLDQINLLLTQNVHPETSTIFEKNSKNVLGNPLPCKVLHRAFPTMKLAQGNHSVEGIPGATEIAGDRVKILHFPYRSLGHYKNKIRLGGAAYARNTSLQPNIGKTWRSHHAEIEKGGLDLFWAELSETPQDVENGLLGGRLIRDDTVSTFLAKQKNTTEHEPLQPAVDELIRCTQELVEEFRCAQNKTTENMPLEKRLRHPHYYNVNFALNGAQSHLRQLQSLTAHPDSKSLSRAFPALRDVFSLFSRNTYLKTFFGQLLSASQGPEVERLRSDCDGKRIILHTSCHHRLAETEETVASFDVMKQDRYHHVVLLGAEETFRENEIPLSFNYDGRFLRVPTPDTYEHLHRKLFFAYMLLDLLTLPEMVIKIDDNLILEDAAKFGRCIERVAEENAAYAGRRVGTPQHEGQWHGWHIGKCADPVIEARGYQYPLPREYASGGYGYVLGPVGLSACAYMYLAMKEFFDLRTVGLEDACVGHAIYAKKLEILDLSGENIELALPGLTTKECRELEF